MSVFYQATDEERYRVTRLCGWKTRDMFDSYNIIDSADLSRAVAQRFSVNGKGTANKAVEMEQAN
jgi:hypothetical protein